MTKLPGETADPNLSGVFGQNTGPHGVGTTGISDSGDGVRAVSTSGNGVSAYSANGTGLHAEGKIDSGTFRRQRS